MAYSVNPVSGPLPREGWRIYGAGNCLKQPVPAIKTRAYPDFIAIPATPGVRDWSLVSYDIDPAGTPVNVEPLAGTGSISLSAASREAIAASRFHAGGRSGCRYPYWRAWHACVAAPSRVGQFSPTMWRLGARSATSRLWPASRLRISACRRSQSCGAQR